MPGDVPRGERINDPRSGGANANNLRLGLVFSASKNTGSSQHSERYMNPRMEWAHGGQVPRAHLWLPWPTLCTYSSRTSKKAIQGVLLGIGLWAGYPDR
eukprot:1337780-Amorphochlora_amoeboformis.AAC.2